jgi:hypothetical protein
MQFQKHFTLGEARTLLPHLRQIFQDIHRRRDRIRDCDDKLAKLLRQTGNDLGGRMVNGLLMDLLQMNGQLQRIQKMGVIVKDLERGLLDFPSVRDGREVFLCWELDENDIEFWHDLDAGYAGRERL